jgi:CyaY protein
MTTEALTEQAFERAADETLRALDRALSDLDGVEVDLQSGILTLEFSDGVKYVVNSHRAARQIWMAAESSAWHFDYHPESSRWIAPRNGDELRATLAEVTSRKLGTPVELGR